MWLIILWDWAICNILLKTDYYNILGKQLNSNCRYSLTNPLVTLVEQSSGKWSVDAVTSHDLLPWQRSCNFNNDLTLLPHCVPDILEEQWLSTCHPKLAYVKTMTDPCWHVYCHSSSKHTWTGEVTKPEHKK